MRNEGSLWNENLMGFSWLFFNCTRECLCPMFLLWAFTFRRNCLKAIWNRVEAALLPKGAHVTLKQTFSKFRPEFTFIAYLRSLSHEIFNMSILYTICGSIPSRNETKTYWLVCWITLITNIILFLFVTISIRKL